MNFQRDNPGRDSYYETSQGGSRSVNTGGGQTRNSHLQDRGGSIGVQTYQGNKSRLPAKNSINVPSMGTGSTNYASRQKNYSPH